MTPNLSPAQREIVEAEDGHYLVVASAGSGKTRVLTERVRHLLEVRKIRSRILALTFTNKAAEEMRQRLRGVPVLSERAYIGTIHSFCQSLIEAHGNVIGYSKMPAILERESDRIAMLEEAFTQSAELSGYLRRHQTSKEKRAFLYGVLEKISLCKRDWRRYGAISEGDWESAEETQVFLEYQRHLSSQGVIDFDDILLVAYRILSERPAIAAIYNRTYRYLFVDEAQDLNPVQYALVRILGEGAASVLLVGDPNQAIYGFNGSSKDFMLKDFREDFSAKRVDLRENYRSSRAVISAANGLYADSIDSKSAALKGEFEIVPCTDEAAACESAEESASLVCESLVEAWSLLHSDVNRFTRALDHLEASVSQWGLGAEVPTEARALALADIGFLRNVWRNYTGRSAKDGRSLGQFRNQMATGETVPNVEGRGVTLATVHAVKGLEYDIVFIIGMIEGGFPDYRAVKAGTSALTEEKNDAFVAVTRCKRLLYLTWPQSKFMPWDKENRVAQRKSRFLVEIERGTSPYGLPYAPFKVAEDPPEYPRRVQEPE